MADLIDRISHEDGEPINAHRFVGMERLYALGVVSSAEIVADLGLTGDELTQAMALRDMIDSYTDPDTKQRYIMRVEAICYCIQDHNDSIYHSGGVVDKAKVLGDLLIGP